MIETLSPRDRLLETADRLFYAEGIHTVGVDRLVNAAGVTRATFYRHFPTKEDLVVAYLRVRDAQIRSGADAVLAAGAPPGDTALAIMDFIGDGACSVGFRGCPFINAAAEYPDHAHPVCLVVAEHRAWFRGTLHELATKAGFPDPDYIASALMLLRDGALAGGELDDPENVRATLHRLAQTVLSF